MSELDDYAAFLAIAEQGSLTAAARVLGRSLQAVSRSLATLEQSLGVELVRRTTRRLQVTEAGQAFRRRIQGALDDIALARQEAARHGGEISGKLRIGGPLMFAPAYLVPAVAAFLDRHPKVEIELALSDPYSDLVAERIDLAVRVGEMPDSPLMARRLGDLRRVAFAAPGYLAAHGRPERPDDLSRHQCVIRIDSQDGGTLWRFAAPGGAIEEVTVDGRFRSTSAASCIAAAAAGLGIGMAHLWQVLDRLDRGALQLVLTDYVLPAVPLHLVWPATPVLPARTRAFIDFLAARLTALPV
jgi:DNA-binding transcriptional LysR family regulator